MSNPDQLADVLREVDPANDGSSVVKPIPTPFDSQMDVCRKALHEEIITYAQVLYSGGTFQITITAAPFYREIKCVPINNTEPTEFITYGRRDFVAQLAFVRPRTSTRVPLYDCEFQCTSSDATLFGKVLEPEELYGLKMIKEAVVKDLKTKFGEDFKTAVLQKYMKGAIGKADTKRNKMRQIWKSCKEKIKRVEKDDPPAYTA